ncbi:tyrosine-type recombinase/integrase [Lysobacter koreensis]|uniref:Tyrosine-type recombinase/integrase n=1 Tax=Lysobacter koreensis TaxID=266122 RepID=A0ABW2YII9_9GAMM
MARPINRLTARGAATAKPGKHADGGGLWLQVTATGARAWVFRYALAGQERFMGLGPLHTVSLARAREDALAARLELRNGLDPLEQRKAKLAARAGIPTFKAAAADFIAENRSGWKNPKHADQWENTLATYAEPIIGSKPVNAITTEDVLEVLRPIWTTKTETASRVRQRIESVLDAARVKGLREGENPARWRGHLAKLLPKPTAVRQVKHFAALPYAEMPAFVAKLRGESGTAARALEFLILTAARTNMVTKAQRREVVGDKWLVPRDRMKARRPHVVPLPDRAVEILDAQPAGDWLFPGDRNKPHLSNAAMDALLERMGFGHVTVHGFRSSFKDWASETTTFPNEVSEAALAHVIKDKAEAAYRRGALLEKRRELMDAWAAYLA